MGCKLSCCVSSEENTSIYSKAIPYVSLNDFYEEGKFHYVLNIDDYRSDFSSFRDVLVN